MSFENLSREDLIKLLEVYAKNWLAHDGCWFLAVEEKLDLETAIKLDTRAWERFSPVEAKRIMQVFAIEANGGLAALERALKYRLYAGVNVQEAEWIDAGTLRFRMVECRVQQARQRKGLAPFACKPVGLVEYAGFARTIDSRIETMPVQAPPDPIGACFCEWEFSVKGD
jgi:hypothetical protein